MPPDPHIAVAIVCILLALVGLAVVYGLNNPQPPVKRDDDNDVPPVFPAF